MEEQAIRVLIVDDHPMVSQGLARIIEQKEGMSVVAEAHDGVSGIEAFRQHRPDVTLMDLMLPDMSGTEAVQAILREFPSARVLILSSSEGDADIYRALERGAWGYLLKGTSGKELVESISRAHGGERSLHPSLAMKVAGYVSVGGLSVREVEVLTLVAEGLSNKRIADRLSIAENTVKMHLKNILGKLNAADRTQAVTIALRRGILHL
ncbi:MAG: response regulator transcription factor [Acidobacteriaceae bacterium]|nr:response regulator transcription factor [Acidobacteriaceae bacterium]